MYAIKPSTMIPSHLLSTSLHHQAVFSQPYCYTIWSDIGIILLSVCLSFRLSVMLCIVALWLVYTAKSCTSVFLAGMFLFVPSDTFAVRWMYRLTTKCSEKNESKKHVCVLVYIDYLLLSRVTQFRRHPNRLSEWICDCVQKRKSEIRFFGSSHSWAWNCNHRFDSSPVVSERPTRSVPHFALIRAPVLTFLFSGRDAAITVNSVKIDISQ